MMKALALALSLPLAACVVGTGTPEPPPGDDQPPPPPPPNGISGHITANTTWMDTVLISGAVTIDPGVTVTVAAGTTINVAATAGITVSGTLDASAGTSAAKITIHGDAGAAHFSGVQLPTGGSATYHYVIQDGGGIYTSGGTFTAQDSELKNASGDWLVMGGGTVNVMYSTLGVVTGTNTTHCNMHFDSGSANTITVSHSNIGMAAYGLMFYGGTNADFTYDNWMGNQIDVDGQPGVTGDFSNSYFAKGAPTAPGGATYTLTNISTTTMVLDAGPRP